MDTQDNFTSLLVQTSDSAIAFHPSGTLLYFNPQTGAVEMFWPGGESQELLVLENSGETGKPQGEETEKTLPPQSLSGNWNNIAIGFPGRTFIVNFDNRDLTTELPASSISLSRAGILGLVINGDAIYVNGHRRYRLTGGGYFGVGFDEARREVVGIARQHGVVYASRASFDTASNFLRFPVEGPTDLAAIQGPRILLASRSPPELSLVEFDGRGYFRLWEALVDLDTIISVALGEQGQIAMLGEYNGQPTVLVSEGPSLASMFPRQSLSFLQTLDAFLESEGKAPPTQKLGQFPFRDMLSAAGSGLGVRKSASSVYRALRKAIPLSWHQSPQRRDYFSRPLAPLFAGPNMSRLTEAEGEALTTVLSRIDHNLQKEQLGLAPEEVRYTRQKFQNEAL